MKKIILSAIALTLGVSSWAQYSMSFHGSDGKVATYNCSDIDSVKSDGVKLKLHADKNVTEIPFASLDSLTFSLDAMTAPQDTVFVVYKDSKVEVVNPFKGEIEITTDGAGVTVTSSVLDKDVVFALSGKSSNGYFLIDSEKKFKVVLDDLDLTSTGVISPIRSLSGKGMTFVLRGKSALTDSANDTCNAVIRSKGQIIFDAESGDNSLTVNAKQKRAIQSGDYIVVDGGKIEATSTLGNCVRTNDYFMMTGGAMVLNEGTLNVTNGYFQMDGGELTIQSSQDDAKLVDIETETLDEEGLPLVDATHGAFFMNGGTLKLTASGAGSRGVKADGDVVVKTGRGVLVTMNGPSLYVPGDGVTNATGIKAGGDLQVLGGHIIVNVSSTADGARAIGADGKIVCDGGAVVNVETAAGQFSYTTEKGTAKTKGSAGIKADGNIELNVCEVTVVSSAASNGAVGVSAAGSVVVNDGAVVDVKTVSASAVALDEESAGSLLLKGGDLIAVSTKEVACDCAISSQGGRLVSVSPYKHASGFSGSTSCVLMDRTYDNSLFKIVDAAGETVADGGAFKGFTSGVLVVAAPFKSGEEYNYQLGSESYSVTAGRAASTVTIVKN